MSHWNYRMTRERVGDEDLYSIREVYYDDDGNVRAWSAEPSVASGETWYELVDDLAKMVACTGGRVLDLDTKEWVEPGPPLPKDATD